MPHFLSSWFVLLSHLYNASDPRTLPLIFCYLFSSLFWKTNFYLLQHIFSKIIHVHQNVICKEVLKFIPIFCIMITFFPSYKCCGMLRWEENSTSGFCKVFQGDYTIPNPPQVGDEQTTSSTGYSFQ